MKGYLSFTLGIAAAMGVIGVPVEVLHLIRHAWRKLVQPRRPFGSVVGELRDGLAGGSVVLNDEQQTRKVAS